MLELNPDMDMIMVPRINTVEGLTPEAHIAKMGMARYRYMDG
jgi:hypothetical protein